MTKHLADQPRTRGMARTREFLRQERTEGMHAAIRALHSQPQTRAGDSRKATEYARIARGRLA
ncbi:MAG: hypothetical protein L0G27_00090 [Paracoccus sp. (in: a-proteobacteria)]|nr:hypothetical protein [Paracoccus sp. (in: a-proteobacteria)]